MPPKDFYEILGVSKDSDADAIKKAYRKLAMQFHPDKNPGNKEAEDRFKEAAEAYSILGDPEKKARYDRFGHAAFQQGGGGGGFQNAEDVFQSFGDIFGDLFGMGQQTRRRPTGPRRGADLRYVTEIQLKDVVTGLEREIEFEAEEGCLECGGTGAEKGTKPVTCPTCNGSGQVVRSQGFFTMASPCPGCHGTGRLIKNPCKRCHGEGRLETHRKIRISIPPGVDNGTRLRVASEGEGGDLGGPPGDLYVEIRVREHEQFQRRAADLFAEVSVPYAQLILGAEVEVPTLTGLAKLTIPRGTQGEQLVKLQGQGLPSLRGSRRGDIYYQIRVQLPENPSKDEERLLREIAAAHGWSVGTGKDGGLFGRKK